MEVICGKWELEVRRTRVGVSVDVKTPWGSACFFTTKAAREGVCQACTEGTSGPHGGPGCQGIASARIGWVEH